VAAIFSNITEGDHLNCIKSLFLAFAILLTPVSWAKTSAVEHELKSLREVRELLTDDLAQYQGTLDILSPDGTIPADSDNPAVKNLSAETKRIRERLISIAERELALLEGSNTAPGGDSAPEAKDHDLADGFAQLQASDGNEDVFRLLALLNQYHHDRLESLKRQPTAEELARREASRQDADSLAKIPFSADKVRLNGAEGITALARISQRLSNDDIPETRRDIAPICGLKTRLYGSLIASENRSLKPIGKGQYIARVRLQPGDTTLRVQSHRWELRLPQSIDSADYLITLFLPKSGEPELHVFAVDALWGEESPYIPAWLPDELNIKPMAG
jgi:hypothetical protein